MSQSDRASMVESALRVAGRCCRVLVAVFLVLSISGCASGISQTARSQVTFEGPFSALQKSPQANKGKVAMLGGRIVDVKAAQNLSEITVLQMPLDGERPEDPDLSEGRFLIRAREFLDPDVYEEGRRLTVVGRVIGGESRMIGDFNYVYPVVEPIEIKMWKEGMGRPFPNVIFGIGVGATL